MLIYNLARSLDYQLTSLGGPPWAITTRLWSNRGALNAFLPQLSSFSSQNRISKFGIKIQRFQVVWPSNWIYISDEICKLGIGLILRSVHKCMVSEPDSSEGLVSRLPCMEYSTSTEVRSQALPVTPDLSLTTKVVSSVCQIYCQYCTNMTVSGNQSQFSSHNLKIG